MLEQLAGFFPVRGLGDLVRIYDGALPARLCISLIAEFARLEQQHERNGAGVRAGLEASGWDELDLGKHLDAQTLDLFIRQTREFHKRYNEDLGMSLPISPVKRTAQLILKRYRSGTSEQFQLHFDSLGPVSNRYLVFLWYLNDVDMGGETDFPDIGIRVAARAGRLLMFPPYWMFQHAGLPPLSGDKYILSTYLLY